MLQVRAISEKNVLLNQASEHIWVLNNQIIQEKYREFKDYNQKDALPS